MIRFVNLNVAFIGLTIAVAYSNYHVKESALAATKRLAALDAAIAEQQVALRTLDAEWSFLNEPSRLQELSARHLSLAQIKPSQVLAVAEMPERLPLETGVRHAPASHKAQTPAQRRDAPKIEPSMPVVTPARADGFAALSSQQ
jgi:hypothetical protein